MRDAPADELARRPYLPRMPPMTNPRRAMLALVVSVYLAAVFFPCPPVAVAETRSEGPETPVFCVYCPCHSADTAAAGAVGADWQGPRSTFGIPLTPWATPKVRAASLWLECPGLDPPAPIPIV